MKPVNLINTHHDKDKNHDDTRSEGAGRLNLRRTFCNSSQATARKNQDDAAGTRRKTWSHCHDDLQLGINASVAAYHGLSKTCGSSQSQKGQRPVSERIKYFSETLNSPLTAIQRNAKITPVAFEAAGGSFASLCRPP